jgi:regulator of protease activity HflC (stomatin/prohibitin superfamily)
MSFFYNNKEKEPKIGNILIGILVGILIFNSYFLVNAGVIAIKFNRVSGSISKSPQGLHFKIPIIDVVYKFDVKTQKLEINTEASSKDLQIVHIKTVINYRPDFKKIEKLFLEIGVDYENKIIDPICKEIFKQNISKFPVEQIIVNRELVKNSIETNLREKLAKNYIIIENVNLVNIDFSSEFNQIVEQKQIEEQKIKTAEYQRRQAEEIKRTTILGAEGEAEKQKLLRQSVSQDIIALKWIEKWNGELPKTMLSDKNSVLIDLKDKNN